MRYVELLVEDRLPAIHQKYAPLIDRMLPPMRGDPRALRPLPPTVSAADVIDYLAANDPSPNKQYTQWLVQMFLGGRLKIEDAYKAKQLLPVFERNKRRMQHRDINQYKSLAQLSAALAPFLTGIADEPKSKKAVGRDESRRMRAESKVVYEDHDWLIVVPQTKEASCYWGRGTQWCTAATESDNYFDQYHADGPLYIIIHKTKLRSVRLPDGREIEVAEKRQLQFETWQFMDENDEPVPILGYFYENPKLFDIFPEEEVWFLAVMQRAEEVGQDDARALLFGAYDKAPPAARRWASIVRDPTLLGPNPSEHDQDIAFKLCVRQELVAALVAAEEPPAGLIRRLALYGSGSTITALKDKIAPETAEELVRKHPDYLTDFPNVSRDTRIRAIAKLLASGQRKWRDLPVENTEEFKLAVVSKHPQAIAEIPDPSPEVQQTAVILARNSGVSYMDTVYRHIRVPKPDPAVTAFVEREVREQYGEPEAWIANLRSRTEYKRWAQDGGFNSPFRRVH